MLVRLPQSLVIAEYFNYDQFGEIVLALPLAGESRRSRRPRSSSRARPANARTRPTAAAGSRSTTAWRAEPARASPSERPPFSLTNRFRGGDTVQNTVGVLGFDFSLYRIQPTGPATYTAANPRPAAPDAGGRPLRSPRRTR